MRILALYMVIMVFVFDAQSQEQAKQKIVLFTSWQMKDGKLEQVKFLPFMTYTEFYSSDNQLNKRIAYINDSVWRVNTPTYHDTLKITDLSFDRKNRLTSIDSFFYNSLNQLIEKRTIDCTSNKKLHTTYLYNESGKLKQEQLWNDKNKVEDTWNYSYKNSDSAQETTTEWVHLGKLASLTTKRFTHDDKPISEFSQSFQNDSLQVIRNTTFNEFGLVSKREIRKAKNQEADVYTFEYEKPADGSVDWYKKREFKNGKLILEERKEVQYLDK